MNTDVTKKISNPILDFTPLFYVMDNCKHTVLAAKKQDKYEVSGVYVKFDIKKNDWEIWPASFNSQLPWEFPTRFEITTNAQEAWFFAGAMSTAQPLPDDWCLKKYPRSEDFPKY